MSNQKKQITRTVPDSTFEKRSTLAIFASYFRPNMKLFILDMVCAFCISIIDLIFPMLTRHSLNTYLSEGNYGAFTRMIILLGAIYFIRLGMQYIVTYFGHIMGADIELQMRNDLFLHLQTLPYEFYDRKRTGHLMTRILSDLFDITELSHHGPEDLFISVIILIGASISLFRINWKLTLILILFLPVLLLFTIFLRKKMSRASSLLKESTAVINADIESSLTGIRVAKAFANEKFEAEKFSRGSRNYREARGRFYRIMAQFFSGMEFLISLLNLSAIACGGFLIMQGEMTVVDLLAFTLYINAFLTPIRKLTAFTELYQSGMAGFNRFVELMREKPTIVNAPDAEIIEHVNGDIQFSHVTFAYNQGEHVESGENAAVLQDVSLTVSNGETIALVGPSGSGKTTLCHLIPRFYEPQSGIISVDGIDINKIEIASLRGHIGLVQQDVFLFAASILENIRYGKIDATDDEIIEAAKKAELHDFIETLPEKYNTFAGERGLLLSGGQKQRIAIARVFLKNPPILILDEATSALDTHTEQKIQNALERLSEGRTCLVVAHRLSTIRNADKIIYLDENGIRESGTHNELIATDGFYSRLYGATMS